jgi:hypothetical protein
MTPFLIFQGIHPAIAVGTDLAYALFSKGVGSWLHHANRTVDWSIVGRLALGSLPASLVCILGLNLLKSQGVELTWLLRNVVGWSLLLTALAMLAPACGIGPKRPGGESPSEPGRAPALTILMGAFLGTVVTLSSIGSGAICAALLIWLYPRLPAISVVGTDLAHAVPLLAIALFGHWQLGNLDLALLVSLLPGAAPGVWLGTHLGSRLPDRTIRYLLAIILMSIGGEMVMT